MASLLTRLPHTIRVLDPGAGVGMLSAAVCERVASLQSPRCVEIHAYETDRAVLPLLGTTLARARDYLAEHGHKLEFCVYDRDFILDGPGLPDANLFGFDRFDIAILNPPYLKINKDSPYAAAMADLVHGQPNLYALFMALAGHCLKPGAQFVAITPRSFCNGPYFHAFRRWFLSRLSIERLHLFESRRDAFAEAEVLQENVITYARASATQSPTIQISHSPGRCVLEASPSLALDASTVINGADRIIRLPVSEAEVTILHAVESWPDRFEQLGLRVSTGPVVQFRAIEFIHRGYERNGRIPLLSVQNVYPFRTMWPARNPAKTLSFDVTPRSRKLLVPAANYVLVRRFSAKEEARRLVASPVFVDAFECESFALENHLNYIYLTNRSLTRDEVLGITAMLNSRLLDVYFRTISGNTQVNAAEIRMLPFPDLPTLSRLGRSLARVDVLDPVRLEGVILETLGINGTIYEYLTEEQSRTSRRDLEGAGSTPRATE